jgi:hypothetical protein
MTMLTMPSVQAQNSFGTLIDTAQKQIVSVTRRGRAVALVMSPQVLQDYMDGYLATLAEAEGMTSVAETTTFLNQFRHA